MITDEGDRSIAPPMSPSAQGIVLGLLLLGVSIASLTRSLIAPGMIDITATELATSVASAALGAVSGAGIVASFWRRRP